MWSQPCYPSQLRGGGYRTGSGSVDQSIQELNWNIINLMRTYFDPVSLRNIRERWRLIECDIRNILDKKIFAIPANRGLCFLWQIVWLLPDSRMNESFPQASHEIKFKPRIAIKENTHRRETSIRSCSGVWSLNGYPLSHAAFCVNDECRFFKSLCVKPTICHSTTNRSGWRSACDPKW